MGALPRPGCHATPANLSPERVANWVASACWEAPNTLTVKWLALWKTPMLGEKITRLQSTNGGLSDTDAKELQVSPTGLPSGPLAEIAVTPVAKRPSALRKSLGSIGEWSLASSLSGSGCGGCFGPVIGRPQSVRFSDGRPSATRP